MTEIKIQLPDGSQKSYPIGTTPKQIAGSISQRLEREAIAAKVGNELVDLEHAINESDSVSIITQESPEALNILRHSAAHLLAQAVKRLYPGTTLAIGPAIDNGFYYDFQCPHTLSVNDFAAIEEEMARLVQENLPIKREEISQEAAIKLFKELGEEYKVELIQELNGDISLYRQGDFVDLCRGPHVPSTGYIKAFKLQSVAGAYWKGDVNRPMLQRVYGTAFFKRSQLDQYLQMLEEAARRDHRKLGKELDLFSFRDEAPGFAFWHGNGLLIYRLLEDFSRQIQSKYGYTEVATPWLFRPEIWKTSGHWDHYKDDMFLIEAEGDVYGLKPMNCPAHCLLYKNTTRSYRDLPIRYAEYSPLSRFELSGTLHGLMRVRGFHQDDAHLFVREDQIESEIGNVLTIVDEVYSTFGMEYSIKLSTRPEGYLGDIETWNNAETALANALKRLGRSYVINEGDGAFYGPKIDFNLMDAIGRNWQLATVQLDFQFPRRFDLTYVDADGEEKRPVMIHRAVMGAIERFVGILTEHFAGNFPTWLAPVQVKLLPIGLSHKEYAIKLKEKLEVAGIRVEVDERNEKIGYKIREAQLKKIPYMLVIGDKEVAEESISCRHRKHGDLGSMKVEEFMERLQLEVKNRKLD